ncbi:hypothetical protein [Novosphingobium sp. ST904]|uniref:hypothetical protein n=1 Tax=Novosphingobium sp. ST904 TaxID=1684385 RepID=UPI0006C88F2C|nr:hypothetical protein [Novosphingobium sp. ST904]TCM40111.1 hypothetical protein EDF59_105351 [Novosphingobium sp. ST904]
MAAPEIDPLPDPPLRSQDSATFSGKAEDWVKALPDFGAQMQAVGDFAEGKAGEAQDYSEASGESADQAEQFALQNKAFMEALGTSMSYSAPGFAVAFLDETGLIAGGVAQDGALKFAMVEAPSINGVETFNGASAEGIAAAGASLSLTYNVAGFDVAFVDAREAVAGGVESSGRLAFAAAKLGVLEGVKSINGVAMSDILAGGTPGTADAAKYGSRNMANLSASMAQAGTVNTYTAGPIWTYNLFTANGQSNEANWEAWPALSKTPRFASNLMIGGSVRPSVDDSTNFTPTGGALAFNPLVSVVQNDGGVMDDAAVAALPAGNAARGESIIVGAVNFAKHMHNQAKGLADDPGRKFVATSSGVGGKTIENMRGGRFGRLTGVVDAAYTLAAADGGASIGHVAHFWNQGEFNYNASFGSTDTKAGYKEQLDLYYAQVLAGTVTGKGQTAIPAFLLMQTTGHFTVDTNDLAIGMAQWEWSMAGPGRYLVGPMGVVTDKVEHLDANGSRWLSMQVGKVLHRVCEQRKEWRPLMPRKVTQDGRLIAIDFLVPAPPIQWLSTYVVNTATDYAAKGFRVTDGSGEVPITSLRIVFDTIVELTLGRDTVGTVKVWYASKTTSNGNGNLFDSDQTRASELYEYLADSGMYASANIPALVNKPYPLQNGCIAFCLNPGFSL